ncbi:MAG: glycosyl hydrolase family 28-related protein [Bacteroidia bacterium]
MIKKNTILVLVPAILFTAFLLMAAIVHGQITTSENKCRCSTSLTVKTKNLKTDFGAKGDNKNDDSFSFLAASDWLNKSCSDSFILKLYIPPGTYLVGLQILPSQKIINPLCTTQSFLNNINLTRKGINLLELVNAKNIIIAGSKRTVVKYKNGCLFGGFDKALNHVSFVPGKPSCSTTKDASNIATLGTFIILRNCFCIAIEQVAIDGNNSKMDLGGAYGECNGYELGHDGIDIFGSKNITIQNVSCNNFGRDGIMSHISEGNPDCVYLNNVQSNNNSRQGFSITAGNNFTIENCSFSGTGSVFYNNPGAGVDIEPEEGAVCTNILFSKCNFFDNLFAGMISDNHFPYVSDITFNDCDFSASKKGSWSIWPNKMIHTVFNNCIIRGSFTHVAGVDSLDRMKFNNCTITDWSRGDTLSSWGVYLIDFGWNPPEDNFYEFNFCKFEIHKSLAIYTVANKDGNGDRIFNHCNWKFYPDDLKKIIPHFPDSNGKGYIGRFLNCTFISNTFNEKSPTRKNTRWYFLEMDPYNNSSDHKNTFAPQNGLNRNKFSRVQNNPDWLYTYRFTLNDF